MLGQMIGISLSVMVLSIALTLFSTASKLALDIHLKIKRQVDLDKAAVWVLQAVTQTLNNSQNNSQPIQVFSNAKLIQDLGLNQPGRGRWVNGSILALDKQQYIYLCEAGLCVKNLDGMTSGSRQVIVSGLSSFTPRIQEPARLSLKFSEGPQHLENVIAIEL